MNDLDVALWNKFTSDTGTGALVDLSNGGFIQTATKNPVFNYTVFQCLVDLPGYAFGNALSYDYVPYQIKHYAVDAANNTTLSGQVASGAMADRCRALLHNASLNVSGKTVLNFRFYRSIPDGAEWDESNNRFIYSAGGIFEIWLV